MKPTLPSTRLIVQARPQIAQKARRENAANPLPGESAHDYLHQSHHSHPALRFQEFGRPGL